MNTSTCKILLVIVVLMAPGLQETALAQESPQGRQESGDVPVEVVLDMLSAVPLDALPGELVLYADMRVAERRAGFRAVTSERAWRRLENAGRSADWVLALPFGVPRGLTDGFLRAQTGMESFVGFSFLDVDRTVSFGAPPAQGVVVDGRFGQARIEEALEKRGYSLTSSVSGVIWCGPGGCNSGTEINLENRNLGNPFGGSLGQNHIVGFVGGRVVASPSFDTVNGALDTYTGVADGRGESLAGVDAVQAAFEAVADDYTVRSALIGDEATIFGTESSAGAPPSNDAAGTGIGDFASDIIVISDLVPTDSARHRAQITLCYNDQSAAEGAAQELQRRLATAEVTAAPQDTGLSGLLAQMGQYGAEATVADVVAHQATELWLVTVGFASSADAASTVYNAVINRLLRRDLQWLR